MGEEAREISRQVVEGVALPRDLTAAIRARILPFDGSAAEPCAAVAADRRAAERSIGQFGCQIAAI